MPELKAEPGDWISVYEQLVFLALDPTGQTMTIDGREAGLVGPFVYWFLKTDPTKMAAMTEDMVDIIAESQPDRLQLGQNAGKLVYGLITSGHVLSYVLRLARHNPLLASVEKAVRILEWRYTQEDSPASPASIKAAWGKYKGLSHFVAGFFATAHRVEPFAGTVPKFFDMTGKPAKDIKLDPDGMRAYVEEVTSGNPAFTRYHEEVTPYAVAMAEKYRIAGEAHYAPGQEVRQRPLLDSEITWRIPSGFELPDVELQLDELSPAEIKAATVK